MWMRLYTLFKIFRRDFVVLVAAFKHPRTPGGVKIAFIVAVLYMLSPVDIMPDSIPFLGILDDAVILPATVYGLLELLPPQVRYEAEEQAALAARYTPHILVAVSVLLLLWVCALIYGAYVFGQWMIRALP